MFMYVIIRYVKQSDGTAFIIFDGYANASSTKDDTPLRRAGPSVTVKESKEDIILHMRKN